jgi:hypothetical protein
MRTREAVARFMECQLEGRCKREKGRQHHYGMQELRELLDFIYEAEPATEAEMVLVPDLSKSMNPRTHTLRDADISAFESKAAADDALRDANTRARLAAFLA